MTDRANKARYEKIVALVVQTLSLKQQQPGTNTDQEKTTLQRQINAVDQQIDHVVYELYGLTKEEIKIVEGE
jgi:primosomal protein N''